MTISWSDLFSEDASLDFSRLLSLWPSTVRGALRPIGMSAFGDVFFERPTGSVERLDVLEGGTSEVALNLDSFAKLMNSQAWQEEHLLSAAVARLKAQGLVRGPAQCFALAPHPTFTGKLDFESCQVMDAVVWHGICSQLLDTSQRIEANGI